MKLRTWVLIAVGILALPGCKRAPKPIGGPPDQRQTNTHLIVSVPTSLTGLERCPGDLVAKTVLRVVIPHNLSAVIDGKRLVRYSPKSVTGDDEDIFDTPGQSTENAAHNGDPEFSKNPFHITTGTIPRSPPDETYLEVRVILRNAKFRFKTDPGGSKFPIKGIAYESSQPGAGWLCQSPTPYSTIEASPATSGHPARPERSVMIFFIRRGAQQTASVNFLIVADKAHGAGGGDQTPILIDPRIKNDG